MYIYTFFILNECTCCIETIMPLRTTDPFGNIYEYTYTYVHATRIGGRRARKGIWGGLEGGSIREDFCNYNLMEQKKSKKFKKSK